MDSVWRARMVAVGTGRARPHRLGGPWRKPQVQCRLAPSKLQASTSTESADMQAADLPITALRELLDSRALSCVELADQCIARTAAAGALNAYASFDAAALRAQALQADARLASGERLPLLGIPIAVKDNVDALGFPCDAGTAALRGRPVVADADLVLRLRAAGALITGKTGMHELAFGITSNNAVSGAVHNPWDLQRIAGGSSGGSGAVVAARSSSVEAFSSSSSATGAFAPPPP